MKRAAAILVLFALPHISLAVAPFCLSLDAASVGAVPQGWTVSKTGQGPGSEWVVVEDATAPGGKALAGQTSDEGPRPLFNLCIADGTNFKDMDLTVSFKAVAGKIDQGGGPVWRYRDANNYYVARMNPLEDNYRVYKVVDGKRTQLGSSDVKVPAGEWHDIRVVHKGDQIQCYLDGRLHLEVTDNTFGAAGTVGLWTKADAQTRFVGLQVATVHAEQPQPVRLIFDTDMMGDVDDVGTVAVLHALADKGEVEILATGLSGKNPWSPLCLDALNTYFRRPDIPIGIVKGPAFDKPSRYAEAIAKEFPHKLKSADDAADAAMLYRKILAGQLDQSVVMVSVGQVTNFRNLLKTGPDAHSDLQGVELVKRKVNTWVCMGGKMPEGREANLIHDGPAAAYAIANWPTPIIFSGWEIGQEIMTGARLQETPQGTPVRRAYELFNGLNDRQSWDQTAALYAVRGLDGGLAEYWDVVREGYLHVNQDGSNEWRTSPNRPHAYLVRKMDPKKIAEVIEELMMRGPGFQK